MSGLKYALIGCGRVAPCHVRAARENGFDIVAVCDTDEKASDRLFERTGITPEEAAKIHRYASADELLAGEKPDLVSVATPSGTHAEIALKVIDAGVNCIIEKPIAMSLADADRIIALAEKRGVTVSACHQNRFNTAVQKAKKALDAGRFGRLSNAAVTVRWSRDRSYYESAGWRGKWESDGGTLMNQCIHGIDLLRWLCGDDVKSIYAVTKRQFHPYIEAEDVGVAVVEFGSGVVATIEGTVNLPEVDMEEHLTLVGERGVVKLGGTSANTVDFMHFTDGMGEDDVLFAEATKNVYGNGHTSLFADVAAAIKEGRPPLSDAAAGRRALETVLGIYLSSATGEKVSFPLPPTVSCADFKGLFDGKE